MSAGMRFGLGFLLVACMVIAGRGRTDQEQPPARREAG